MTQSQAQYWPWLYALVFLCGKKYGYDKGFKAGQDAAEQATARRFPLHATAFWQGRN